MNYADVFCLFFGTGIRGIEIRACLLLKKKRVRDGTKNEFCPWVAPKSDIPPALLFLAKGFFLFSFLGIKSFFNCQTEVSVNIRRRPSVTNSKLQKHTRIAFSPSTFASNYSISDCMGAHNSFFFAFFSGGHSRPISFFPLTPCKQLAAPVRFPRKYNGKLIIIFEKKPSDLVRLCPWRAMFVACATHVNFPDKSPRYSQHTNSIGGRRRRGGRSH